jgi:hypothetical protein
MCHHAIVLNQLSIGPTYTYIHTETIHLKVLQLYNYYMFIMTEIVQILILMSLMIQGN